MTEQEYIDYISREPLESMIRKGNGYLYIPKSILQKELLLLYKGHTKWEMLRDSITKNGLWGTGILHYKHPVTNEWLFVTGTASLPHEKKLRLGFPSLEAHCMINACKKIGVWFGQTLNIEEDDAMPDDEELLTVNREHERLVMLMEDCNTIEELAIYKPELPRELMPIYINILRKLTTPESLSKTG